MGETGWGERKRRREGERRGGGVRERGEEWVVETEGRREGERVEAEEENSELRTQDFIRERRGAREREVEKEKRGEIEGRERERGREGGRERIGERKREWGGGGVGWGWVYCIVLCCIV